MLTSSHNFSLISFGQDSVPASIYAQVEKVYIESMGLTARTETNEIAYWRDRYNDEFGHLGDRLFVFGLLREKEAIGFALVFYFKSHNLLVVDHITIKEPARHFGAFFYFKELIAQHIADEALQVDYVLVEIVTSKEGDPHPVEPHLLIDLLKQREFKVVRMEYYTPSIRVPDYQNRIATTLMMMRHDRGDRIASGTMLALLECVLFNLYIRWYTPHSRDLRGFKKQIAGLFSLYREQLSKEQYVTLNGSAHPNTTLPIIAKPRAIAEPTNVIVIPVLLLVALLPVSACLLALSYWLGASTLSVLIVFLVVLFACLVLLAVWHKPASQQADRVIRLLSSLLRNQKNIR
jgi:hypothetical protein